MSQIANKSRERSEQKRSRETKSRILNAALTEFAAVGFEGSSTRGIAARAGVNHTLITHHFGAKEALWKATAAWVFENYTQRMNDRLEGLHGVDEAAQVRILLREFILICADVPEFHRFMMQAGQGDSARLTWLAEHYLREGTETEVGLVKRAQAHGLIPPGDPFHMRFLFINAAASIFAFASEFSALSGKDPSSDAIVERHVDYVLNLFSSPTSATK